MVLNVPSTSASGGSHHLNNLHSMQFTMKMTVNNNGKSSSTSARGQTPVSSSPITFHLQQQPSSPQYMAFQPSSSPSPPYLSSSSPYSSPPSSPPGSNVSFAVCTESEKKGNAFITTSFFVNANEDPSASKEEVTCSICGKIYKHRNCLTKHLWEHNEHWEATKKYTSSKHQQVQLLEAATALMTLTGAPVAKIPC